MVGTFWDSLKSFDWNALGISIGFLGAAMAVGLPCSGSAKASAEWAKPAPAF